MQIARRLFPFHRGLIHAYWAPNAWALYTAADRVLIRIVTTRKRAALESMTRGLVGDTVFGVLPDVEPRLCFMLTAVVMLIYLARLWQRPTYRSLVACVTLCAMSSFMFGWHVHEKAILLVLIPLGLIADENYAIFRIYTVLSVTGIVSLFPLLFTPREVPIALAYATLWLVIMQRALARRVTRPMPNNAGAIMHWLESVYMVGAVVVAAATNLVWPLVTSLWPQLSRRSLEFLPLLLSSVYCAVGLVWCWLRLSYWFLASAQPDEKKAE